MCERRHGGARNKNISSAAENAFGRTLSDSKLFTNAGVWHHIIDSAYKQIHTLYTVYYQDLLVEFLATQPADYFYDDNIELKSFLSNMVCVTRCSCVVVRESGFTPEPFVNCKLSLHLQIKVA